MNTEPQIEAVTDEDARVATQTYFINMKQILAEDRRRVVERQANHGTTHAEGCVSWGRGHYECARVEIERLRAEVAKMHARRAVLFGELMELKRAIENGHRASAIAIIDAIARVIPDQSKTLAELRAEVAALKAAQANMIDATGAVEATCFSHCEVIGREPFGTYRDVGRVEVPKDWAGDTVLIVRVRP